MLLLGLFDPECADGMLGRAHIVFPDFEMVVGTHSANGANRNTRTQPLRLCLYLSDLQMLG